MATQSNLRIKNFRPIQKFRNSLVNTDCNRCHLGPVCREDDSYPVASSGLGRIMFVGHAPGENEMKQGIPFVGEAGRNLKELIRSYLGLDPEQHCYLTNATKCSIGKPPTTKSRVACAPYLVKEISIVNPRLIVFLGKESAKNVVHPDDLPGIGESFSALIAGESRDCFVMYHTALIMRSPKMEKVVLSQMEELGEIVRDRFGYSGPKTPPKVRDGGSVEYILVDNEEKLEAMKKDLLQYKFIGLDTETTSLKVWEEDFSMVGVSLAGCDTRGYYVPVGHMIPERSISADSILQLDWEIVRPVLELLFISEKKQAIFHNYAYDCRVLSKYGLNIDAVDKDGRWYHDSMIMSYLEDENVHSQSLKEQVAMRFREQAQRYSTVLSGEKNLAYKRPQDVLSYAADDAINALRVFKDALVSVQKQSANLTEDKLLSVIYPQELRVAHVMSKAHMIGIAIDIDYLQTLRKVARQDLTEVSKGVDNICNLAELTSPTQITKLMRQVLADFPVKAFEAEIGPLSSKKDVLIYLAAWYENQYNLVKPEERKGSWWSPAKLRQFIEGVIIFKRIHKSLSTYIEPIINKAVKTEDGYVLHPEFKTVGTTSGRMSCEKPNIQNLPREQGVIPPHCAYCQNPYNAPEDYEADITFSRFTCTKCDKTTKTYRYDIRRAFVARPGRCLVLSDFANMEVIVTACASGDTNLYGIIQKKLVDKDDPDGDMHLVTAAKMFKTTPHMIKKQIESPNKRVAAKGKAMRQAAKSTNFGAIYGIGKYGLYRSFVEQGLDYSVDDCQDFLDAFFLAFPKLKDWWNNSRRHLQVHHNIVNMFGRIRHVSQQAEHNELRSAVNFLIQGACAQVAKQALIDIDDHFHRDPEVNILNMVHDEVVVECPVDKRKEVAQIVSEVMEQTIEDKIEVFLSTDVKAGVLSLSKAAEEIT